MASESEEAEERLQYDPGEHRAKHCWNNPFADVVKDGSHSIGKCPSTLSKEKARDLLDEAEYVGKAEGQSVVRVQPERMWNVFEGIVYEAVPTQAGSYHGYPWIGRPGHNRLPRKVKVTLKERAEQQGHGRQFKNWMRDHES